MIVEDDRDVRETIAEILEDNDYVPLAAANGQEAIDRLRSTAERPCMILLDIMMPIMDGWQFRAAQQKDPALSAIPVVVLSAHANITEAASGMQAAGSLPKPVALKKLMRTVEEICPKT